MNHKLLFKCIVCLALVIARNNIASANEPKNINSNSMTAGQENAYLEKLKDRNKLLEEKLRAKESKIDGVRKDLDSKIKEVDRSEDALRQSIETKKLIEEEQLTRMAAIYKSLKPQDAANIINKLDEDVAIRVVDKFDKRTLKKMIPLLKPGLAVTWSKKNLPLR